MKRAPALHHCTSHAVRLFGRRDELALLDRAMAGDEPSVAVMIGPGGQGKTAIVQHWLASLAANLGADEASREARSAIDGVFLWSFYRGRDSDLFLRELLAHAEGMDRAPEVSASYCVDKLLPILARERWAVVLDGAEVVQHERGAWQGRFVHPELGRLLEELASIRISGVVVVTSRFRMPTLEKRVHARIISLSTLDLDSAISLLQSQGVAGSAEVLAAAASACGLHAKAVELYATCVSHFHEKRGDHYKKLPPLGAEDASDEEAHVLRVLRALQRAMGPDLQDILALATSFRQPVPEARLAEYLRSDTLRHLLHETWGRSYPPFASRPGGWLEQQIHLLVDLRLLERVPLGRSDAGGADRMVLDAHPLVRSGFEHVLGGAQHKHATRAGFLRGRPDRRPPQSLDEASEEVELFHAYADAELWNEADSTLVALDNPKHRFLAPAFERDLLVRFFPNGDWRQAPLWPGFGRYRSLAMCFEMLGQFEEALAAYRPADAALRGDALIALGRLQTFLDQAQAAQPWQTLWQAYRAHALALSGRKDEALRAALLVVPSDIYEWVHVFECLLRIKRLDAMDLKSLLYRPPLADEPMWSRLARERMRLDFLRVTGAPSTAQGDLGKALRDLIDAYDRGGLPFERVLTRLSLGRHLQKLGDSEQANSLVATGLELCERFSMARLREDCLALLAGSDRARP